MEVVLLFVLSITASGTGRAVAKYEDGGGDGYAKARAIWAILQLATLIWLIILVT